MDPIVSFQLFHHVLENSMNIFTFIEKMTLLISSDMHYLGITYKSLYVLATVLCLCEALITVCESKSFLFKTAMAFFPWKIGYLIVLFHQGTSSYQKEAGGNYPSFKSCFKGYHYELRD